MRRLSALIAAIVLSLLVCAISCSPDPANGALPALEKRKSDGATPEAIVARFQRRVERGKRVAPDAVAKMIESHEERLAARPMSTGPALVNWQSLGPGNVGGRVRSLVIHPTTPQRMWVAASSGGIWKTENGGASWSETSFPGVLSVACMAMDPTNPNILYAGTGEGFFNASEGSSNTAVARGAGVYKSFDAGATWSQLASTANFGFVNRIAIDPRNTQKLFLATESGLYRSANGGILWVGVILPSHGDSDVYDVRIDPNDSLKAVAGRRGHVPIYTVNGGNTWLEATGIPATTKIFRSELRYARSQPGMVYCVTAAEKTATNKTVFIKVYRSSDGGKTYTSRTGASNSGKRTIASYCMSLWVDPTDSERILVGGLHLFVSNDGGMSLTQTQNPSAPKLHKDQHFVCEAPGFDGNTNKTVYCGNDGGVYVTHDVRAWDSTSQKPAIQWTELNNQLAITQFYSAAMGPTGVVYGGTQDNGTQVYTGNSEAWTQPLNASGDGGFCAADRVDPLILYGAQPRLEIHRSMDGGATTQLIPPPLPQNSTPNFIAPFILDPNWRFRILAGAAQLWKLNASTAATPQWVSIKAALNLPSDHINGGSNPGNISAIAVADGNPKKIWVGHNNGQIFMTKNGKNANPTWLERDAFNPVVPDRWISRIAIHPARHSEVWVALLGYKNNNLWRTTNGGLQWTDVGGTGMSSLPVAPITSIALHPTSDDLVYVGTDVGIYWTEDAGTSWQPVQTTPRYLQVEELSFVGPSKLMITTYGRGIFTADVPAQATAHGSGCGLGSSPLLDASMPRVGRVQRYTLASSAKQKPVFLLLSVTPSSALDLGNGCSLYPLLSEMVVLNVNASTDASGNSRFGLPVPPRPELAGTPVTTQALIVNLGGPAFGLAELSNGIQMRIGR